MFTQFGANSHPCAVAIFHHNPYARASILGANNIRGKADFYYFSNGTLVVTEVFGLPKSSDPCSDKIFAYHIHEGSSCTGTAEDPYENVKMHYNPHNCKHPQHAGDMPPLFGNDGYAWSSFYTNRFNTDEIIGKTVVIHSLPDDFTSQPSGDSGAKIACGEIKKI